MAYDQGRILNNSTSFSLLVDGVARHSVVFLVQPRGCTNDPRRINQTKEKCRGGFHEEFHFEHPLAQCLNCGYPEKLLPWFLFYKNLLADEGMDDR